MPATPPSIVTQPTSQVIISGYPVTFAVVASGDATLTYQWEKGGVIISGATSDSYSIGVVSSGDAANYTCTVTNGAGTATSAVAVLTVAMTITDAIELKMADLIAGMKIAGGYNFDWGIVNEQDEAIGAFPRCVIDPTDTIADKETNQDSVAGIGSNDYTNEVFFTLLVKGELPVFNNNPLFAIRSILRQSLDDLKKLFGINYNVLGSCDNILYAGSQIETLVRNDVQRPAQLRVFLKTTYSQDRQSPKLYASS